MASSIEQMIERIRANRRRRLQDRNNLRKLARSFWAFNHLPTMWQTDGAGELIRVRKYKPTTTRYQHATI